MWLLACFRGQQEDDVSTGDNLQFVQERQSPVSSQKRADRSPAPVYSQKTPDRVPIRASSQTRPDKPPSDKVLLTKSFGNDKDPSDQLSIPITAQTFTFSQLAAATNNFKPECLIGEGGFGRVYKGRIESIDKVVAIKQLNRDGRQGNREFLVEVLMLSLVHHPNLVNLIGYCADGDQRLLVYEFMPLGCLEHHLYDLPVGKEPLDWSTRMKIAAGSAQGLEYLHHKANPPIIYRDFKSSNILLDEGFEPKLSDFGLAKLGPSGDKTHVSTRVMGTLGYCAPEYAMTGQLTAKSDIYSFGVVLLELITGRKAIDMQKTSKERNLVTWALPRFKDPVRFEEMADPLMKHQFPMRGLHQALAMAAMCLQADAAARPAIGDVVTALNSLASKTYDATPNTSLNHRLSANEIKEKSVRKIRGEQHKNIALASSPIEGVPKDQLICLLKL